MKNSSQDFKKKQTNKHKVKTPTTVLKEVDKQIKTPQTRETLTKKKETLSKKKTPKKQTSQQKSPNNKPKKQTITPTITKNNPNLIVYF